jgi:hypothetical protein
MIRNLPCKESMALTCPKTLRPKPLCVAGGGLGPTTVVEGHLACAIRGRKHGRSDEWVSLLMGLPPKPE